MSLCFLCFLDKFVGFQIFMYTSPGFNAQTMHNFFVLFHLIKVVRIRDLVEEKRETESTWEFATLSN